MLKYSIATLPPASVIAVPGGEETSVDGERKSALSITGH